MLTCHESSQKLHVVTATETSRMQTRKEITLDSSSLVYCLCDRLFFNVIHWIFNMDEALDKEEDWPKNVFRK